MTAPLIPPEVRAIAFDAVGTLIHPDPDPATAYFEAGRLHGSRLDEATVRARFREAFRAEDEVDRGVRWRTGEGREEERWRAIVAHVLDDVTDLDACFDHLWRHFALPTAWRADPDAAEVLPALAARGYHLALASNFDERLHGVAAGLPELGPIGTVVVSSEVGWRKPGPEFFAALCSRLGLAAAEVLLVGDDVENDLAGARGAGLPALLIDPRGGQGALTRLLDLLSPVG